MPTGTCAEIAALSGGFLTVTIEKFLFDGVVYAEVKFTPDAGSLRPNCDGPIVSIRTRSTASVTGYIVLPNKKNGNKWVSIDPNSDTTISAPGQLTNLGLLKYSDAAGLGGLTTVQPT